MHDRGESLTIQFSPSPTPRKPVLTGGKADDGSSAQELFWPLEGVVAFPAGRQRKSEEFPAAGTTSQVCSPSCMLNPNTQRATLIFKTTLHIHSLTPYMQHGLDFTLSFPEERIHWTTPLQQEAGGRKGKWRRPWGRSQSRETLWSQHPGCQGEVPFTQA